METGIASSTDTYGHMLADTVWQEQDSGIYDDFSITYVDAADEEDATRYEAQDGKVAVHYYVPDTYDEEEGMALVLYVTGWQRYFLLGSMGWRHISRDRRWSGRRQQPGHQCYL